MDSLLLGAEEKAFTRCGGGALRRILRARRNGEPRIRARDGGGSGDQVYQPPGPWLCPAVTHRRRRTMLMQSQKYLVTIEDIAPRGRSCPIRVLRHRGGTYGPSARPGVWTTGTVTPCDPGVVARRRRARRRRRGPAAAARRPGATVRPGSVPGECGLLGTGRAGGRIGAVLRYQGAEIDLTRVPAVWSRHPNRPRALRSLAGTAAGT